MLASIRHPLVLFSYYASMERRLKDPWISHLLPMSMRTGASKRDSSVCGRRWQAGFWKHLPWTGLLSLFAGLLCGIGAILIVHEFDNQPIDHWKVRGVVVQPTVLLSVLATASRASLSYAFTTGIAIFWWNAALHGTTLKQLHVSQQQSSSLRGLCSKRPMANTVAFASIITLLLMAEGPLLQKALHVVTRERQAHTELSVPISSSPLMSGSTGVRPDNASISTMYSPMFVQILRQYNRRENIFVPDFGCRGTCYTDIVAAGWDLECSSHTSDYRLLAPGEEYRQYLIANATNQTWTGPSYYQDMFDVSTLYWENDPPTDLKPSLPEQATNFQLNFTTMIKATKGVNGTFQWHNCLANEALVRYRVKVVDDSLTLLSTAQFPDTVIQRVWRQREPFAPGRGSKFSRASVH
jgi:hypothetical protein